MGKYFPNNWQKFKDAPEGAFYCPTFEEFTQWKLAGWDLPESVVCIIRSEENGKIKEYTYQRECYAEDRLSLIHISEPTRLGMISYAVFCLKKKK